MPVCELLGASRGHFSRFARFQSAYQHIPTTIRLKLSRLWSFLLSSVNKYVSPGWLSLSERFELQNECQWRLKYIFPYWPAQRRGWKWTWYPLRNRIYITRSLYDRSILTEDSRVVLIIQPLSVLRSKLERVLKELQMFSCSLHGAGIRSNYGYFPYRHRDGTREQ